MVVNLNYFNPISDDLFDGQKARPRGVKLRKGTGYQNLVTMLISVCFISLVFQFYGKRTKFQEGFQIKI